MDWALHQQQVRFDIRAERAEYEYLCKHQARVLQDRLARLGGGDRTKEIPIADWERVYREESGKGFRLGRREKVLLRSQVTMRSSVACRYLGIT
jgi:hypothetical protein